MAAIIKAVFGIFWAITTALLLYLGYIVLQTEYKPQLIWAWLVMCCFTFISVTWLASTILFARRRRTDGMNR